MGYLTVLLKVHLLFIFFENYFPKKNIDKKPIKSEYLIFM